MNIGSLDRRLEIWRAAIVDDGFAQMPGAAVKIGTVWAAKTDVSDSERFRNGVTEAMITTRFQVRWSSLTAGILASDLIEVDGRRYGVVGIKEIGRREGLEITALAEAR